MRAFIIRPFGTKKGIDFDRVERELIDPALTKFDVTGRTTGEIMEAGNIRTDMFQQLLVADLVIADISTNNANALYELGIRHALRDCHTYLLRSQGPRQRPAGGKPAKGKGKEAEKEHDEVPFDLRTDRYLTYDPECPAKAVAALVDGLRQTLAGRRKDSPVFLALPGLEVQDHSRFTPVPQDFGDEVARAAEAGQPERLALLAMEVSGFTWETEGLRVVGRAQFRAGYMCDAQSTWESVRDINPDDLEASLLLGTIYQRLGDLANSNLALERVAEQGNATARDLAEAHALMGRNQKQLWQDDWNAAESGERRLRAFRSPLLLEAYRQYHKAFLQDLNAYYPGINALAMLTIFFELAKAFPEEWTERFEDERQADCQRAALEKEYGELQAAIACCVRANKARIGDADPWLNITEADLCLLTSQRPGPVSSTYRAALSRAAAFMHDSVRRQLNLYAELQVLPEKVAAALSALAEPAAARDREEGKAPLEHVILFTGHRLDESGRRVPRFPPACEARARVEIRKAVAEIQEFTNGGIRGVAGAASGGDLLFHEVCRELGVETLVCLALPPGAYIAASVQSGWEKRFHAIVDGRGSVPVLAQKADLPPWLTVKKDYTIWQRNNLWELCWALVQRARHLTVVALWDGKKGDGPGGTEHMVEISRRRGAKLKLLDTRLICGLGSEAKPPAEAELRPAGGSRKRKK
jgi:hypothetical protein